MQLPVCEKCGNEYDKAFTVVMDGKSHTFDCFECAISKLAPHCNHCNTLIIGHGVEAANEFYCCAHCAKSHGHFMLDRPIEEKIQHI